MSDEAKPVEQTPEAAPAAEVPTDKPAETTPAPAADETEAPAAESKPAEEAPAATEDKPAETAAPVEVKKKEVEPIHSGALSFKGPAGFPKNLLGPQKTYFWLGDEAVPATRLTNFLQHSKAEHAHPTAAWSSQTGKGLLYYAKHEKDKGYPSGVILLADVVDITPLGHIEFTFKVHGQKYSFLTTNKPERDGWLKSIKAETETAKGKREEIQASEGYKKTLEELKPAVAGASVAGATAAATPSKKSDERATREENGTTKSKSRSVSRGKRGSIFDRLSGKKEEAKDEAKEVANKKDEPAKETEAPAAETTNDVPAETTTAVAEETKKEEVKADEPKKVDEPKANRRTSKIGDFFKKIGGESPAQEKKSVEPATAPAPVKEEAPKVDDKPEEAAATAATEEVKKEEAKKETATTPKSEKKTFLDRILPKDKSSKQPTTEATPKKSEAVKSDEQTTEDPATTEVTAETEPAATSDEAPATNGDAKKEASTSSPTEPKDKEKRRSSFFTGDLPGSWKKIGQKADKVVEPEKKAETNGEPAKTAEPAKETPATTPAVAAAPVSKKENPIVKLSRRVSTALRGGSKERKEAVAPSKVEESTEATEAKKVDEPPKIEEPKPVEETKPAEGDKPVNSIGDVVPEAVNVGSAPPATATVSATA